VQQKVLSEKGRITILGIDMLHQLFGMRATNIFGTAPAEELYDLKADPLEQHNVAGDQAHSDAITALKMQLLEWHALSEDPLDPISIRQLQQEYDGWETGNVSPGAMFGPGWLNERFRPNPRVL